MVLAFHPKMIDVFSKHNGEIVQVCTTAPACSTRQTSVR